MAIDSHIHLYPESVYSDPASWATSRGERYWLSCVRPTSGPNLQAWKSEYELLHDMDTAGVERVVIVSWYWENHDTCIENFQWQKKWIAQHPDRILALAPFAANGGDASIDLLKEAYDLGFSGMGELNPPAQGYDYRHPILQRALELTSEYELVANFHVTDPDTHDYPGKIETPYSQLTRLVADHPKATFIFSHLGGLGPLRENCELPPNLYFDTAATPLLYKNQETYRKFLSQVSADRILFGSDYPLRVFPRKSDAPDLQSPLDHLEIWNLNESERELLTSLNAKKLFKIT